MDGWEKAYVKAVLQNRGKAKVVVRVHVADENQAQVLVHLLQARPETPAQLAERALATVVQYAAGSWNVEVGARHWR